ncbi:uncharacterized protein CC84DRAFT_40621 [Paraphaeosphaeria sporulosa]|uniref:Uncharacterized protein n=1 Tax=Paraphaeosphaeria sporulosa TaxID=1460663 RepID=A0A177CWH1_9PLEO|nr:uncharacterized protein CC84DRAFT_40621 [Paraphaeosphaeria sporulosa]OAG11576.1 hypothetical protein CC84DRAFT_40621 [Paraphaeosphaeria sporulosa]
MAGVLARGIFLGEARRALLRCLRAGSVDLRSWGAFLSFCLLYIVWFLLYQLYFPNLASSYTLYILYLLQTHVLPIHHINYTALLQRPTTLLVSTSPPAPAALTVPITITTPKPYKATPPPVPDQLNSLFAYNGRFGHSPAQLSPTQRSARPV